MNNRIHASWIPLCNTQEIAILSGSNTFHHFRAGGGEHGQLGSSHGMPAERLMERAGAGGHGVQGTGPCVVNTTQVLFSFLHNHAHNRGFLVSRNAKRLPYHDGIDGEGWGRRLMERAGAGAHGVQGTTVLSSLLAGGGGPRAVCDENPCSFLI